jgi:PIN domain nuclease of toxin-antitoxin system
MTVLDTHTWLWWVSGDAKLSRAADKAIRSTKVIGICSISCLEVAMGVAKGRILLDRDPLEWMQQALALDRVELLAISPAIAVKATQLGREFHSDPADRLIVATTILEAGILVTKDQRIRDYPAVTTVW